MPAAYHGEYMKVGRDPTVSAKQWEEVEKAYRAVVGLPPKERDALLETICSKGDPKIRPLVMELLKADGDSGDSSDETLPDDGNSAGGDAVDGFQDLEPGQVIDDRYRIEEVLGEGGMGTIYRATQISPIERTVAIKVIKLGMDTRRVITRFELERQALAVMNHPNIARILDAGATERGRPYFVMELVPGAPITKHCNTKNLGVDARLKLFLDVCRAVQHAHQKGVIHRDLKPSNVLVTHQDGKPIVKIIDFGIAKATGSDGEHGTATETTLMLGTPAYMSPEQVEGGSEVDTRTDVYALGLVLYELLTGVPAFKSSELRQAGLVEMQRMIKEVDPERPSTRVGRVWPVGQPESSARRRRLQGDLDWIVMKALAKEPEHRYETAFALALDIRRHFDNQPVSAGPPSTSYVLGKFARRNKRLLAVASAFLLLVIVGVIAMYLKSQEALLARDEAAAQLRISNVERGRLLGRTGDVGAAEELIWREYLRDPGSLHAYWALWEAFAQSRCVASVTGHHGRADEIDIDESGSLLVSAGDDGRVVIRDAPSMKVKVVFSGPDEEMRALALSNDGRIVAAGGAGGVIVVWDIAARTQLRRWRASDQALLAMDFSRDGTRLVSGGADGVIRVWDSGTGALLAELDQGAGLVQVLRFSPDGSLIAAGHVGMFTLWDGAAPRPQKVFPAIRETHALAFSRDGQLLAGGGQEQVVDVWELSSGSRMARFEGSNSTVRSLVFGPEDRSVFSACWYTVDRWDLASRERVWSVPSADSLWGIVVDPTGRLLTASLASGELRRWEVDREGGVHRMSSLSERTSAALTPDGSAVFVGDHQGRIQIADLVTADIRSSFDGHESGIWSLDVSGDGSRVASASADGAVRVLDVTSGALVCAVDDGQIQTSRAIDLDDAGLHLAYAATGGRFKVRRIADGNELVIVPPSQAESLSIAFNPAGESLATTSRDGNVRFWTLDGESIGEVPVQGPWTMSYSPDGDLLALGLWDRSIRILNTADFSVAAELEGHGGTVWVAAFKPDDPRILASAAADGTVRLWDVRNQLNVATIPVAPNRDVHTVSFTADGTTLLAAGEFGSAVWYDLTHLERHIAGNLEYYIERLGDELSDEELDELRSWAADIMQRPWPRFGPREVDGPP